MADLSPEESLFVAGFIRWFLLMGLFGLLFPDIGLIKILLASIMASMILESSLYRT